MSVGTAPIEPNSMRTALPAVLFFMCSVFRLHAGTDEDELMLGIAQAFKYPANRLTMTEKSFPPGSYNHHRYHRWITISSPDDTFATVGVKVSKMYGLHYFNSWKEREAQKNKPRTATGYKEVWHDFGHGAVGCVGVSHSERTSGVEVQWPERDLDLAVYFAYRNTEERDADGNIFKPLRYDEETRDYYERITRSGRYQNRTSKYPETELTIAMQCLVDYVEKIDLRDDGTEHPRFQTVRKTIPKAVAFFREMGKLTGPSEKDVIPPPNLIGQANFKAAQEAKKSGANLEVINTEAVNAPIVQPTKPASSTQWLMWAMLIVAAIGLLWLLLKRRS